MEEKPKASSGGAAPTSTPTPVTVLSEAYPSTVMNWTLAAAFAQMAHNASDGKNALGCVQWASSGICSTTSDHVRNDFTTAATIVTTRFAYDFSLLAGLTNTVEIRLELDGVTRWRFEVANNGGTIYFNGAAIACGGCGTPTIWHTAVIVSNGNNTTSLVIDGAVVASFTAASNNLAADDAIDKLHVTLGGSLNTAGAVFQMDDVLITAP